MMNPEIRDGAYQFFIEEAPELLQIIESGLLTLADDRSTSKVHEIMRAAHSLKGGAASVELDTIKTLAHRLEDIFKAFYDETVELDQELESWLFQAFDCLKDPLTEQIETGRFDQEAALAKAMPLFTTIEERLGDSLAQGDQYIPSSADLGIDIVSSIFEVDVAQGLDHLRTVVASPNGYDVATELKNQMEVFRGFSELLNLPGFGAIAETVLTAVEQHQDQALAIAQVALADFQNSYHQVLEEGDRTQGGEPSTALLGWLESKIERTSDSDSDLDSASFESSTSLNPLSSLSLDDLFEDQSDGTNSGFLELGFFEEEVPEEKLDTNSDIISQETIAENPETEVDFANAPPLDDIFGHSIDDNIAEAIASSEISTPEVDFANVPSLDDVFRGLENESLSSDRSSLDETPDVATEHLEQMVQSVEAIFDELPPIVEPEEGTESNESILEPESQKIIKDQGDHHLSPAQNQKHETSSPQETKGNRKNQGVAGNLSVKVDFERLERMNNLIGELAINRNSLSLNNDQLQGEVKTLVDRFRRFQEMTGKLREFSDQMLIAPERYGNFHKSSEKITSSVNLSTPEQGLTPDFDSLEMDSYGTIHFMLQTMLDQMIQLEESVDDIVLFANASNQTLNQQRQMLNYLRDELMWARMLPLSEILNRFPRVLRDLSTSYKKRVKLHLHGTGVLVEKAALEKLYDPLLHLLRNAFDHGIEPPEMRRQLGKSETGNIYIHAYHQGNQTIIEMRDDGRGLNLDKIAQKAVNVGLITPEQLPTLSKEQLQNLIFEPGFSTATQVSDLSGRGVGLDVVREQLRTLKGNVWVSSIPGQGTSFTLSLPLTLTIGKLLVCLLEHETGTKTAIALPSDSIDDIIMPQEQEIKKSGTKRFLYWKEQIIPIYSLEHLLEYRCPLGNGFISKALQAVPHPEDWGLPLLILRQGQQFYALEVTRLVTEQELVIKPFGQAIAAPKYTYGCTILGDGTLIPVIDGNLLIEQFFNPKLSNQEFEKITPTTSDIRSSIEMSVRETPTILVVDDSATLRRTLALTLQRTGYRVLQAKDGYDALEQLQQNSGVKLVICDIEMPNMNGFEFLGKRRGYPDLMEIPVAMLTSRSSEKHRQLATHLGASAYFTKPYIENQFLEAIQGLMVDQPSLRI